MLSIMVDSQAFRIIAWQPFIERLPLPATKGRSELCLFEPWKLTSSQNNPVKNDAESSASLKYCIVNFCIIESFFSVFHLN